jgi:hypothetical protein
MEEPGVCSKYLKITLGVLALLGTLLFFVFLIIRLDADARGVGVGGIVLTWPKIFAPLGCAAFLMIVWMLINYVASSPPSLTAPGKGGHVYYSLTSQLLVKDVATSSINSYNEGIMLRNILRFVAYALVVGYSAVASQLACKDCEVPYQMLAYGFLSAYALRMGMLVYNGRASFARLNYMAEQVRLYQESLDQSILDRLDELYRAGKRFISMLIDAFLWVGCIVFAVLGTVWVKADKCADTCLATFHTYEFLLIAIYSIEAANLLSFFSLIYYERVSNIEFFESLVTKLSELHEADSSVN